MRQVDVVRRPHVDHAVVLEGNARVLAHLDPPFLRPATERGIQRGILERLDLSPPDVKVLHADRVGLLHADPGASTPLVGWERGVGRVSDPRNAQVRQPDQQNILSEGYWQTPS